jgi:hypothetical protein
MSTFLKGVNEFSPFPDGQPHVDVQQFDDVLQCRIRTGDDLIRLGLAIDVYRRNGFEPRLGTPLALQ